MAKDSKRRIVTEFTAKDRAKGVMAVFRRDMDTTGRAMKRMAMGALAMVGLGGGIYAVKRGFDAVTKAAMTQERAERDLMAATQGNIAQFKDYAAQMQALTVYGDEQILTQMAYAKNLGVTSEQLEKATTAAIGLAARYRIDLAAAMMLVGRASQGQTQMLTRYGIIVDQNLSAQDKFSEVLKIGAQSFRLATEETKTAEGALAQLKNTYGDILEIIGEPMAQAMAKNARATKDWLESVRPSFKRYIDDMAEGMEMMKQFNLKMLDIWMKYSPLGLAYQKVKGPAPESIAKPAKPRLGPLSEIEISDLIMERNRARHAESEKLLKHEAEQRDMMQGHRIKMMEEGGTLEAMEWRQSTERIRMQMEFETEAREKAAAAETERLEKMASNYEDYGGRIKYEIWTWGEKVQEFGVLFQDSIAWGLENTMRDFDNWKEHLLNMFEEIYWSAVRIAFIKPLAGELAGGMTAGLSALFSGGGMPTVGTVTPAAGATMAKYQYGGIVKETGPAWVHKGEEITPPGGGEKRIDVHLHNEQGEDREISHVESYIFSDQRIIDVFTRRAQTDEPLRRSIKQATR